MNSPIIESPHRQGMMRRIVQGGITLFFWGVWLYLMLPLLAPLMALAEIEHTLLTPVAPAEYLRFMVPVVIFVGVVMLGMELWVRYKSA